MNIILLFAVWVIGAIHNILVNLIFVNYLIAWRIFDGLNVRRFYIKLDDLYFVKRLNDVYGI